MFKKHEKRLIRELSIEEYENELLEKVRMEMSRLTENPEIIKSLILENWDSSIAKPHRYNFYIDLPDTKIKVPRGRGYKGPSFHELKKTSEMKMMKRAGELAEYSALRDRMDQEGFFLELGVNSIWGIELRFKW